MFTPPCQCKVLTAEVRLWLEEHCSLFSYHVCWRILEDSTASVPFSEDVCLMGHHCQWIILLIKTSWLSTKYAVHNLVLNEFFIYSHVCPSCHIVQYKKPLLPGNKVSWWTIITNLFLFWILTKKTFVASKVPYVLFLYQNQTTPNKLSHGFTEKQNSQGPKDKICHIIKSFLGLPNDDSNFKCYLFKKLLRKVLQMNPYA